MIRRRNPRHDRAPGTRRPTDAELGLLQVLWRRGPSTVRQVQAELDGAGYTTVLKTLQIMTEKGLVRRDESGRAHVYAAEDERAAVQRHLVGHLLERAFEGSASQLVLQALAARPASAQELAEIRDLLDEMAGDDEAPAGDPLNNPRRLAEPGRDEEGEP